MGIKITQPFSFDSNRPNFERDTINSAVDFASGNPLVLTSSESTSLAAKYDIGHIVWDTNTNRHYRVAYYNVNGYRLVPIDTENPTFRTMNHEQLSDSGLGDINIHDGYYFPNAVQDAEGNWYGAVVIGDQVWMGENLYSTVYDDGNGLHPIEENITPTGSDDKFCTPMLTTAYGYDFRLYNWYAAMSLGPNNIQGISPTGWHIPRKEEFEQLVAYISLQKRHIYGNNDQATAKSLSATFGWTCTQSSPPQEWPGVDLGDNNSTGFNALPTGYYNEAPSHEKENSTFFWSSTYDGSYVSCMSIDGESEITDIMDGVSPVYFCAVRCISNLNPVQFRDWYVNTYGTMQHHLASVQVQANWNETNASSASYIQNKPTIPAAQIQSDWNQTNTSALDYIKNKPNINLNLYEEIRYADLLSMKNNGSLVKGMMYRIVDYSTTAVATQDEINDGKNVSVAGHNFDLVVTAVDVDELDPRAIALSPRHDQTSATYWSDAGTDLEKWFILYDIENNTRKYAWADDRAGKGVIYRMIDEFGNDCPYDFKNILFSKTFQQGINSGYSNIYTFDIADAQGNNYDYSLDGGHCNSNVIEKYIDDGSNISHQIMRLGFNVFRSNNVRPLCFNNRLGKCCHDNYFLHYIRNVVFGENCNGNSFSNSIHDIHFGNYCSYNIFESATSYIWFGNWCQENRIRVGCFDIELKSYCSANEILDSSNNIEIGFSCGHNIIDEFSKNIRFGDSNNRITLTSPAGDVGGSGNFLQNVYFVHGFRPEGSTGVTYTIPRNQAFRTTIGLQSNGTPRVYTEEDITGSVQYAQSAGALGHTLTIGPHTFDGSADVTIGMFDGDGSDDFDVS